MLVRKQRLAGGAGFRDFLRLPPAKENRDSRWTLPAFLIFEKAYLRLFGHVIDNSFKIVGLLKLT